MLVTLVIWSDERADVILGDLGAQKITNDVWAVPESIDAEFRCKWQGPAAPNNIFVLRIAGIDELRQPFVDVSTPNYLREAFPQAEEYRFIGSP